MIQSIPKDIRDLSYSGLVQYLNGIEEKSFRAAQIFDWIYKKSIQNFEGMTNLPSSLKKRLTGDFVFSQPSILKKETARDQTRKFLFEFSSNEAVETVLIPTPTRSTVCVSTQAGCKFGCRFCASGIGGWNRDLSCAEILSQILYVKNVSHPNPLSHVVFMGTGEPLDNYQNLLKAIRIMNAAEGMNIAARRITISTVGLIPRILQLAQENIQVELAISLHGYNDDSRNRLMPVNKKYPFTDLIEACKEYIKKTNRQITFEYILIKGVTCSEEAARELKKNLKSLICKMNLIPYNPVQEFDYQRPSRREIHHFQNRLKQYGVHATVRSPRGTDVSAACGQLRYNVLH